MSALKSGSFPKAIISLLMTLELTSAFLSAGEMDPMSCSFRKGDWNPSEWIFVKRRDMAGRSEWLQKNDCIENDGDHTSMVYAKKQKGDMTVSATIAFADRMAPAIVIVSKLGDSADGAKVFDEHVEIVIYDEGVNIWRLHTVDGKSLWEKIAFWKFKLTKNTMYKLEVTKKGKELSIKVDDRIFGYIDNSLQEEYYVGITGCEGVNRFYDFAVQNTCKKDSNSFKEPSMTHIKSGEFFRIYDPSVGEKEKWYINDHCFIQGPDKIWHLFGITHTEPANPLDEDNFAHATALTLTQSQWEKRPFALTVDPNIGETHLWAPHVILNDGTYYMFYCAGDNDHSRYKIHLATSKDLKNWRRHPANPMVVDGFDARDPYILRIGDEWAMYYTANSEPNGGNHIVACRKSKDLIHWGDRITVFTDPLCGTYGGPTESPFVIARKGMYYLFVCTNAPYDNTAVYESTSPFRWDIERKVGDIPAHCAEVIYISDDEWYISRAGWDRGGVYLAKLYWNDCPTDAIAPSPISREVGW